MIEKSVVLDRRLFGLMFNMTLGGFEASAQLAEDLMDHGINLKSCEPEAVRPRIQKKSGRRLIPIPDSDIMFTVKQDEIPFLESVAEPSIELVESEKENYESWYYSTPQRPVIPPSRPIIDPYSTSSGELIMDRQICYLRSKIHHQSSRNVAPLMIVNYYGHWNDQISNITRWCPGKNLIVNCPNRFSEVPRRAARRPLIEYKERTADGPDSTATVHFIKEMGRGGTSTIMLGMISSKRHPPVCGIVKIVNRSHWKSAFAEIVASAAVIDRLSRQDFIAKMTDDDSTIFVEGCAWIFPTELHLYWDKCNPPDPAMSLPPRFHSHAYPSLCALLIRDLNQGLPFLTLINNVYIKARKRPSHEICVYFSYLFLSMVRQLHVCDVIHGDVKPDNFVLYGPDCLYPGEESFRKVQKKNPLLSGLLGSPPIFLAGIDFGRALDVRDSLRDITFIGDTQVSDFRCPSMLDRKPWEVQIDLTGVAVTIYTMISLRYPRVRQKFMGATPRAYWFGPRISNDSCQNEFWLRFFDRLINFCPSNPGSMKMTEESSNLLNELQSDLVRLVHDPIFDGTTLGVRKPVLASALGEVALFVKSSAQNK